MTRYQHKESLWAGFYDAASHYGEPLWQTVFLVEPDLRSSDDEIDWLARHGHL